MKSETHLPTEILRPFIKSYLIIESEGEMVNRVLPDTSLVIAFRFKGQINYITDHATTALPASAITGLRKSVRLIHYLKHTTTLLIVFRETGAAAIFKEPLHELFEESVSLDRCVPRQEVALMEEQLAEAENNKQRIAIVESFLLSKSYNHHPDKLILGVIQKIRSMKGVVRIKELAETFSISQDALEKRFRKTVGTSPKQFASIIRLRSIIHLKTNAHNLTDLALEGDYFDQSHFNKDFKLFTGQTPTAFFKSPSFW